MSEEATYKSQRLTDVQRLRAQQVRDLRADFVALLHKIGGTDQSAGNRLANADLTLALRHMEDAEYRAVRGITGGPA